MTFQAHAPERLSLKMTCLMICLSEEEHELKTSLGFVLNKLYFKGVSVCGPFSYSSIVNPNHDVVEDISPSDGTMIFTI